MLREDPIAFSTQKADIGMAVNLSGKADCIAHLHAGTARCKTVLAAKLLDECTEIREIFLMSSSGAECSAQCVASKTASNNRPNLGVIHAQNRAVRQQESKHFEVLIELRSLGGV